MYQMNCTSVPYKAKPRAQLTSPALRMIQQLFQRRREVLYYADGKL